MPHRRFSQAIAEGDGISVIVAVEDADAARAAEAQRAEALVVTRDPAAVRDATSLPILWRAQVAVEQASAVADLPHTTRDDVDELERAGVDAVIVGGRDVSDLVGGPPPQV